MSQTERMSDENKYIVTDEEGRRITSFQYRDQAEEYIESMKIATGNSIELTVDLE